MSVPRAVRRFGRGVIVALGLAGAIHTTCHAQCAADSVVPDLPFLSDLPVWARSAGMGGATAAVGADVSSLRENPATLALLRRIEVAGSFLRSQSDVTISSLGSSREATTSGTRVNGLAVAYPFPVYRGSFVIGASYEQPNVFDLRTVRVTPFSGGDMVADRITETGGLRIYRVGAAVDVAREVSVGASGFYERGPDRRSRTVTVTSGSSVDESTVETQTTGSAWGATLGALFRVSPYARIGTMLALPRHLTYRGTGRDPDGTFRLADQEFRLPATLVAGVAITPPTLIVSVDVSLTDWAELEYNADPVFGQVLYRDENAYRSTADLRAGVEWLVPRTVLRLRGGVQSTPLRVRFLPDVVSTSECATYLPVDIVRDRRATTVGAGYLVADAFTLDVAWMHESYERRTASPDDAYRETRTDDRVTASVAFRL